MALRAKIYVITIIVVGSILALLPQDAPAPTANPWLTFTIMAILASFVNLFVAEIPNNDAAYFATPVFVFASLLLLNSYLFTSLVVTYHLIEWFNERLRKGHRLRDWYIQPFNVALEIITGVVVRIVIGFLDTSIPQFISLIPVFNKTIAAFIFVLMNHTLLGIALMVARNRSWKETGMLRLDNITSDMILLLLGYVTAVLWEINYWLIIPALSPLVLMYRALQVPALEQEAQTDGKTGLLNPRYFNKRYEEEFARAQRFNRPLTVIMADLDFLRHINNTYGHLAGDTVIEGIAHVIKNTLRSYDIAGRFGGEEFAIVLPETDLSFGIQVAERIRRLVDLSTFKVINSDIEIKATISIGIATFQSATENPDQLLHMADEALYEAKSNGRNCISATPKSQLTVSQ